MKNLSGSFEKNEQIAGKNIYTHSFNISYSFLVYQELWRMQPLSKLFFSISYRITFSSPHAYISAFHDVILGVSHHHHHHRGDRIRGRFPTDETDQKGSPVTWYQRSITLPSHSYGIHEITQVIRDEMPEIGSIETGILHLFLRHTSASLTINENADPDVPADLNRALEHVAPESLPFRHTIEGPDDMPAHVKSSLVNCSLQIPIGQGSMLLGTWQGIYLCEHRKSRHRRKIVATLQGEPR
jgi:secondary thiamine-phosphate synthase enzyme